MHLLELKNLKKYFATQKAVDDISFNIEKGSIFGLLGPNGAGKTTLLRMITGIFYPDSGEILFNGTKFRPVEDAENIGYMPEERGLYKKMKIGEQAMYLARLKGMSQKLQFVTTVFHEPDLIILDEPFSGLDPVNANLIKEEIFGLAKKGCTIIFSTHRMEQVEEICDHIILVNKGQKILDGTVAGVKQQFKENLYTVGSARSLSALTDDQHYEIIKPGDQSVTIRLKEGADTNIVLQSLLNKGISINRFNEELPSLNDIFIKLVEGTATARQFQNVQ